MAKSLRPLGVFTIALALLFLFASGCEDQKPKSLKGSGTDFTLNDLEGNSVSLRDFRGKVVMLEFWATWCPPCRDSVPELLELKKRFEGQAFELIAISMDESTRNVVDFVEEFNITYTVLMDTEKVSGQYGVFSIPTTFLIDKQGKVASKHMGYGEGMIQDLAERIEELIHESAVPDASGQGEHEIIQPEAVSKEEQETAAPETAGQEEPKMQQPDMTGQEAPKMQQPDMTGQEEPEQVRPDR